MTGLLGNHGKRCALFFCLDHAESVAIHQQQIVTAPGFERDFAQRDAAPGGRVGGGEWPGLNANTRNGSGILFSRHSGSFHTDEATHCFCPNSAFF